MDAQAVRTILLVIYRFLLEKRRRDAEMEKETEANVSLQSNSPAWSSRSKPQAGLGLPAQTTNLTFKHVF